MGKSTKPLSWVFVLASASLPFTATAGTTANIECVPPALPCSANTQGSPDDLFSQLLVTPPETSRAVSVVEDAVGSHSGNSFSFSLAPDTLKELSSDRFNLADSFSTALASTITNNSDRIPENVNVIQMMSGADALFRALSDTQANANAKSAISNYRSAEQSAILATNLLRNVGNISVSATLPGTDNLELARTEQQIQAAINSEAVTTYLSQHEDIVMLMAKMLGWETTGLLPTATDIQKMASSQLTSVANSIESWALNNVSLSTKALASSDVGTYDGSTQWQWSLNNSDRFASNTHGADFNDSNLGTSLRAMFGINEY